MKENLKTNDSVNPVGGEDEFVIKVIFGMQSFPISTETPNANSGSTHCSPRPRMSLKDMTSLKDWHPGYLDLTDPLVEFHGKKIVGSEWLPGGVTLYFNDGTKGVIEMMMDRNKFEVKHGKMITNGELYLTGSVSRI